jgi:transcriptional regulator with XRE-family HTH domain
MDAIRFGLGLRALRHRRRWSQETLAARTHSSRSVIGRIERGHAGQVAVHTLERIAGELGARVDVRLQWQGEGLDRLLDQRHAHLVERVLELLDRCGWTTRAEVTFSLRGERGSIDVLAFHPPTACLIVVEVKSVVPDLQAMLVALDRKGRLGRDIAREGGWIATSVTRLLVLPDDRTSRRRVDALAATFRSALPARTIEVRRWIHQPAGPRSGILFLADAHQAGARHRVAKRSVG